MMEEFTTFSINQLDKFFKSLKSKNNLLDFDLIAKVLDLILIILYFWKTKDETLT
jgi:hypothetical protein